VFASSSNCMPTYRVTTEALTQAGFSWRTTSVMLCSGTCGRRRPSRLCCCDAAATRVSRKAYVARTRHDFAGRNSNSASIPRTRARSRFCRCRQVVPVGQSGSGVLSVTFVTRSVISFQKAVRRVLKGAHCCWTPISPPASRSGLRRRIDFAIPSFPIGYVSSKFL